MGSDGRIRGSAVSDEAGAFGLNVDLAAEAETLTAAVTAPSGFRTEVPFEVAIDRTHPRIALDEDLPRITAADTLVIAGRVDKPGASLNIDGRPVPLNGGAFNEIARLKPGANPIELVAADAVGNIDIARFVVTLDTEPPRLVQAQSAPMSGEAGSLIAVEVAADDESGLARTARFNLTFASETVEGVLNLNRATSTYQGTVAVPRERAKSARLRSVDLTDAAGNRKTYRVN
jgi:hypothetical protein